MFGVGLKPQYSSFTPYWYMDIGKGFSIFLFTSVFVTGTDDLKNYMKLIAKQFYDRGFRYRLKSDPTDEDDDNVYTKFKVQKDLIGLYTGPKIKGAKVFARMMSTLFIIMMYSSGMPIIYFVGMFWFTIMYIINKLLIVKYYQTTMTFTRIIPEYSIILLKTGIIFHILCACFMLTNAEPFETISVHEAITIPFNFVKNIPVLKNFYTDYKDDPFLAPFLNRLKFLHQQIYMIFVILFIILYYLRNFIVGVLQALSQCI